MLAQSAKVLFAQNFLFTRYTQVSNYKNMLELFGTPNLSVHVLHLQWSSCDVHPTSSQELLGPVAANDEAKCQIGRGAQDQFRQSGGNISLPLCAKYSV